jgi:hypothetical protein
MPKLSMAEPSLPELSTAEPPLPKLSTAEPPMPELSMAEPPMPELSVTGPPMPWTIHRFGVFLLLCLFPFLQGRGEGDADPGTMGAVRLGRAAEAGDAEARGAFEAALYHGDGTKRDMAGAA